MFFLTLFFGAVAVAAPPPFNLTEIAPGVFVHRGQQVGLDHPARGDSANIGFVVGSHCVAVIDTGGSLATGRALRAAIAARTARPICFVINTHAHFDHVLGNAAFLDSHPKFVGHHQLKAILDASRDYFKKDFARELAGAPEPAVIVPTIAVEATRVLDLGGRELRLKAELPAHSDADLTVLDSVTQILWTGDLVFMERLPVLDGKLEGWLTWMANASAESYVRIVPGHGPVSAPWPAALQAQRAYLEKLKATVQQSINAGQFLEDAVAQARAADLRPWRVTAAHPRNISKAFREYEWQ
ncbi:MAG: quinoprotein relay system zinc metallohydrolase 2 [Gammaproteobacteria bacterium]|nr:quinoprotein relay system zinc metallohydrolase 2 [Gammaproteobacteria bacterium]